MAGTFHEDGRQSYINDYKREKGKLHETKTAVNNMATDSLEVLVWHHDHAMKKQRAEQNKLGNAKSKTLLSSE